MQHVDDVLELYRIYRPVSVSVEIVDNPQHTRAMEAPFIGFAAGCFPPNCVEFSAVPITILTSLGNARRSSLELPMKSKGLRLSVSVTRRIIPFQG